MSPFTKVLIVIAAAVVLLALVIMFVFTSQQMTKQETAKQQATTQQQKDAEKNSPANTEGSIGPIKVNKSTLYNRENDALGKSGSGPKSVITNAEVDIPPSVTSGQ